jgi:hypothetical protein
VNHCLRANINLVVNYISTQKIGLLEQIRPRISNSVTGVAKNLAVSISRFSLGIARRTDDQTVQRYRNFTVYFPRAPAGIQQSLLYPCFACPPPRPGRYTVNVAVSLLVPRPLTCALFSHGPACRECTSKPQARLQPAESPSLRRSFQNGIQAKCLLHPQGKRKRHFAGGPEQAPGALRRSPKEPNKAPKGPRSLQKGLQTKCHLHPRREVQKALG